MKKRYLAFVLHFHQPVGNFEDIFERAYQLCYYPYVRFLLDYPEINMTFHLSGSLLDYLDRKHPEFLKLLKVMVTRGQIELLGGGYYEPIFTAIPQRDLTAQMEMMSNYLRKRFNISPEGMWISERVWEPRLAKVISAAGMRYSVLDDMHLIRAGIKKKEIQGYFLTSSKLAIFASDKVLRYKIPFRRPEGTIDYLRKTPLSKGENPLFVYGDDVEKFGEWPGTHNWVYKRGWLKHFFNLLIKNRDWLETVKLSEYLKNNSPRGRLKIPAASYKEMMQWSDGSWMNFLSKYPESNQMHKKMHYVSGKIARLGKRVKKKDEKRFAEAKKELYKGQCNCAYWHGVFGGLYLYHLRQAVYYHLIKAEKIADNLLSGGRDGQLHTKWLGHDRNKKDEMIMENKTFSLYLDPNDGGVIKELDYKPFSLNLINTLSRRRELYHRKILKVLHSGGRKGIHAIHEGAKVGRPKLKTNLCYDKFPRYCLRDHFIKQELKVKDFMNSTYNELGGFANGKYTLRHKGEGILLERKAKISQTEFKLSKEIRIRPNNTIEVDYHLEKHGSGGSDILLGVEFNITMPSLNAPRYRYFFNTILLGGLSARGTLTGVDSFGIHDSQRELEASFHFSQKPKGIWYFPIMTLSQSEKHYRVNYQSSCILPRWKPTFNKDGFWDLKITWKLG